MARMRLDKYLAEMGKKTRSQAKDAVKKGRVFVNGETACKADIKIDTETDSVQLDGAVLGYVEMEYYMLNKPAGVVSATEDSKHKTVLDLIEGNVRRNLFPVGRLDIDTEGLLLITNDGALSHQLLSPRKHVDKVYYVETDGPIPEDTIKRFAEGVDIGEKAVTLPAELKLLAEDKAELTIREGKYHQVKRMFEAVGRKVTYLKRISMGGLTLDASLPCGASRLLTKEELEALKKEL